MIKLKRLVESPDGLYDASIDRDYSYIDADAYAFYYDLGKKHLYISDTSGEDHFSTTLQKNNKGAREVVGAYHASGDPNNELIAGRVWINNEIISFWEYPNTTKEMKIIADDVSKHFGNINIWNNFNLEIYDGENDEYDEHSEDSAIIIPIKKYKGSDNPPEEEYQQHLLSPIKKKKIKTPKGIGSKKTPGGFSATQLHQIQSTSENKIKESPDWVDDNDGKRIGEWSDDDAFAFGYYKNKMFISSVPGGTHGDIIPGVDDTHRTQFKFGGRIWAQKGAISFWDYPKDNSEMQKVAVDLSKAIEGTFGEEIDIWNEYYVDIIVDTDNRNVVFPSGVGWANDSNAPTGYESKLIKVKDFSKSKKRPDDELTKQHVMSPMKKKNVSITKGIGSKKTLAGLSATQLHQMKMTSDGTIKLKSLIESPDNLWIAEPGAEDDGEYIGYMEDDAYGFYFSNGNLYISNRPGVTHGEGVMRSGKYDMDDIVRDIYNGGIIPYGRIWVDKELLSFWSPPKSRKEMRDIANELSYNFDNMNVDVWNDFEVEVYDKDNARGDGKFIPVKSYKSSEAAPDEDFQRHLLSPAKKKDIDIPKGIGSKKTPAGLSVTQRHQVQSTSEIKESPDKIDSTKDGKKIAFGHGSRKIPYVFGYYKNELQIMPNTTHLSLPPKGIEREGYEYPGRLWTTEKIISFWIYPENKTKLYKIFKDINNSIGININPKDWYVDVLLNTDSKKMIVRLITAGGFTDYDLVQSATAVLIPASEYEGSLNNDMSVKHMIVPIMKSLYGMKVPKNWGSKRVPAGLSTTQRHQLASTSEGLKEWSDGFNYDGKSYDKISGMDTIAFGYDTSGDLVFDYGVGHAYIGVDTMENKDSLKRNYAGRVWLEPRVMTFWGYPESKNKLKQIISDLNHDVRGLHINKGWKIEIPKPLLSKRYVKFSRGKKLDFHYEGGAFGDKDEHKSIFIPINDYDISLISNDLSAEKKKKSAMLQHLASPMIKKSMEVPKDVGSKKTPIGMSATQRHQMQSTSENKR